MATSMIEGDHLIPLPVHAKGLTSHATALDRVLRPHSTHNGNYKDIGILTDFP